MERNFTYSDEQLVGLTPEQREAVTSTARRLLVRATAGSGKTHVLTLRILRRISLGELEPDNVLAMTFTRKAGDELRKRLWQSGISDVRAGTFHRAALTIVTNYRTDHHLKPLTVEPQRRRLVTLLITQMREDGLRLDDYLLPRVDQEIGWALSQDYDGATYVKNAKRLRRDCPVALPIFADILDRYVGLCRSRGVLDFDLLLSEATALLREHAPVRAAFRHRTHALFVDETQDMNPLQLRLLQQMAGDDPDLFCVGDPNQSIYGFNGASPRLLNELVTTWPDMEMLDLTRNHRSTAHIITVANTMLEPGARGIEPARDDGAIPVVRSYDTDEDEARHVAQWLASHHSPRSPWKSMAVLARTNAQLDTITIALERAHIPYERRGPEHSPASDLVADAATRAVADREATDAVALSTIHRAKGLEFRHVACVGWGEGQIPHYNAATKSEVDEEKRLAYVALSRAEESLLITWSKGRNDPRFGERAPSIFLAPIEEAIAKMTAAEAPLTGESRRAQLAALRAQMAQADAPIVPGRRLGR